MKDIKSIVYWIIGFLLADGFRYLLRDVDIPEIFKWALGIVIILGGYIFIDKLLKKRYKKRRSIS
ncbi:hypothetical protein [Clostridium sp. UBA7503]|uniref:hypothetical protein n=1 Tax=Clostridium sp. UBA7503 TaxID=1946377 RepID=UPI0032172C9F